MDVGNDGSDEVAYTYTGDLKRVWRHESGELKNTYKWDAGFNVVQETYWSGGSATMTKAYAGGLAEVDVTSTPSYSYPTWDHLGSTRGMWDDSIGQLGSWEYTPYGSPYLFAGPSDVTQLFTGHDLDAVTGKYYAPFRYLDPAAGRWLKRDPLGMVDGPNMYSYVAASPIRYVDRMGGLAFDTPSNATVQNPGIADILIKTGYVAGTTSNIWNTTVNQRPGSGRPRKGNEAPGKRLPNQKANPSPSQAGPEGPPDQTWPKRKGPDERDPCEIICEDAGKAVKCKSPDRYMKIAMCALCIAINSGFLGNPPPDFLN